MFIIFTKSVDGNTFYHARFINGFPGRQQETTYEEKGYFYLFSLGTQYRNKAKMYLMKLYRNGTLVRDYVPVLDPQRVPALFDKVSGTLFHNVGTGSFKTNLDE